MHFNNTPQRVFSIGVFFVEGVFNNVLMLQKRRANFWSNSIGWLKLKIEGHAV